jgi:trimeric autotransporter adhesin
MQLIRLLALAAIVTAAASAHALQPPEPRDLHDLEFRHAELWWGSLYQPLHELPAAISSERSGELDALGVRLHNAFLDVRSGRWGTLILTRPMIPGTGVGNELQWSDLGRSTPTSQDDILNAAAEAYVAFLQANSNELGFNVDEFAEPRAQMHGERLIQLNIRRQVDDIPVRDTFITASINSGNLVLMGQRNWADVTVSTRPALSAQQAEQVLREHLGELAHERAYRPARLEIIPVSSQSDQSLLDSVGDGMGHRLAWVVSPWFVDDIGTWEALIDAHSGELLAFEDTNHYHDHEEDGHGEHSHAGTQAGGPSRGVIGGIFPVSNDGTPPDGVEMSGYPMPFANVSLDGSAQGFTTTGGNAPSGAAAGSLSTTLSGQYVGIDSQCGSLNVSSDSGDLDLGDGAGTDCSVPPGTSPGNTNAARTVFYGVGRINEQARGYLPNNSWLTAPINGVTNTSQTCNATWSTWTNTATFYNSGSGCGNTGEIMAVVHHEWGHGMDANSVNSGISRPGEGIADIYAQNMLNDSCVGRGFFQNGLCTGFGDPCLECSGVRESDWALQESGQPHDIQWAIAACPGSGNTPCGSSTHCEGSIVAEAVWDLVHRDLRGFEGSPFNYDVNTALELGTRLTYWGAGAVGDWFQCNPGSNSGDGCNADSGYLQYLAADADNGSIEDGTPHMSAIFAAFDRHQLACSTPVVQDSGCDNAPTSAPAGVTATTFNEGVQLSWDAVDDATEYWVYRTEGPMGCEFGKALVGQVTDTSFTETGLRNGFEVNYSVVAVGDSSACTSPMSGCMAVTPMMGPSGTVSGTITRGGTGDAIEGVLVEAIGDEISFSAVTDASGSYSMIALEGSYDIVASKDGFATATSEDVVLEEDESITVDLVLDAPQAEVWPPLVEVTAQEGGSAQSSLSIENVGTLELEWSLSSDEIVFGNMPLDGHDPERDEALSLNDFTLPGGGSSSESVVAGIETRGQVIGFSFEGTVAGISGTATWASDMALTVTGPDGSSFSVGGYQTGNPPWDFDGSGSGNDGTYTSTHIGTDIFGEDGALDEGEWTFDFQHTWNDTMNWSDVTITLHKTAPPVCQEPTDVDWLSTDPEMGSTAVGSTDAVEVLVDATSLSAGEYQASLCLVSNDPGNELVIVPVAVNVTDEPVDPPAIDVDPQSLTFELEQNASFTDELVISNLGDQTLSWSIDDTESCELPGWILASSMSGSVGAGQSATLDLTVDATGLDVDDYQATLCIESNDPSTPLVSVIIDLEVSEGPALISGTVTGLGYCGSDPQPVTDGEVLVQGQNQLYSAPIDGDGQFQVPVPAEEGPVDVLTDLDGYLLAGIFDIEIQAGGSVVVDIEAILAEPCASVVPESLEFTLAGDSASEILIIGNLSGGAELQWLVTTEAGCHAPESESWLSLSSSGDSVGIGSSQEVTVTADAAGLEPGQYQTQLCIETNDGQATSFSIPVTLEAEPFEAAISGTVNSLGYCSDNPSAAPGAEVLVQGQDDSWTVVADAEGDFQVDLPAAQGPFDVTASAENHIQQVETGITVEVGESTEVNFDLVLDAACAVVDPEALELTLLAGEDSELQLLIGNMDGGGALSWSIAVSEEANGCESPSQLGWLSVAAAEGSTEAGESSLVSVLIDSGELDAGEYGAWLCITTDDEQNEDIDVAVLLEVLGIDIFQDAFEASGGAAPETD